MNARRSPRPRKPLNKERLHELALHYVGRFATTRAKLASYLDRKLRERGWEDGAPPDVERLVERLTASGLVDDALYALSKSRTLSERGYGAARVRQSLRAAGVDEEDGAAARELASEQAVQAAVRFAKRRRIGPFAEARPDRPGRQKALAAMVRAGHSFELARKLVDCGPGEPLDMDELTEESG